MTKVRRKSIASLTLKEFKPSKSGRNESSASRSTTAVSCTIPKFVWLQDWWLDKADGKGLAVGGFACRETKGVRVFCSAAIAKRLDATTLETTDGITVTISGLINTSRTYQNGFPFEVCNCFLLGFPYYWEEYASVDRRVSGSYEGNASSRSTAKNLLQVSLEDLPVTRVRDLLVSVHRDYDCSELKTIYNGILGKLSGGNAINSQSTVDSGEEKSSPATVRKVMSDETPSNHKKCKVNKKSRENRTTELSRISNESETGLNVSNRRKGVSTRSMTRLDNSKDKQNGNMSPNSSVKDANSANNSKKSSNIQDQSGEKMGTNPTSTNANRAAAKSRNDKKVITIYETRSSSRQKTQNE